MNQVGTDLPIVGAESVGCTFMVDNAWIREIRGDMRTTERTERTFGLRGVRIMDERML